MTDAYDIVIIGAGPGGYVLALDCGRRGLSVALVEERKTLGGTCLNVGCIPSKALLESSAFYNRIRAEAAEHGIELNGDAPTLDIKAMMARKAKVVVALTDGIASLMKARGVEVIHGRGTVVAPGEVKTISPPPGKGELDLVASERILRSDRIVLATGSAPMSLPALPFDGKRILDSSDALALQRVPKSLAVVGAGAVGLELGSVWSRLGSKVTVIEAMDRIVPGADAQAVRVLASALKKQGLVFRTGTLVESAETSSRGVTLTLAKAGTPASGGSSPGGPEKNVPETKPEVLKAERVLVAVGRRAAVDAGLGPDVRPRLTEDGRFLAVDDRFSTSIPGLYALGDLIGGPMLAHKAEDEALALAALFAGEPRPPWAGPVPGIVYTEPELAWAGETEDSLKMSGAAYEKGHFPFAANGRALAAGASDGFAKVLSSPGDGRLLGVSIVGHGASELIAEAVSVMAMGGCAEDLALTVHGHPTMSEALREAALALAGRPLHRR